MLDFNCLFGTDIKHRYRFSPLLTEIISKKKHVVTPLLVTATVGDGLNGFSEGFSTFTDAFFPSLNVYSVVVRRSYLEISSINHSNIIQQNELKTQS